MKDEGLGLQTSPHSHCYIVTDLGAKGSVHPLQFTPMGSSGLHGHMTVNGPINEPLFRYNQSIFNLGSKLTNRQPTELVGI